MTTATDRKALALYTFDGSDPDMILALHAAFRAGAEFAAEPTPAPSVVPEAAVEGLDYTDIANRAQAATGRSIWPSTAEAVIAAALPFLTAAPSATRDEVARLIDPSGWRYFDTGMFPPDHPASTGVVHNSRETADALLARFTITPKEDR